MFTWDNVILIKNLYLMEGYNAIKQHFPDKGWKKEKP